MWILEPTSHVAGVALPFRTYEHEPRRAVARGLALIRRWRRATGAAPSPRIARLALAAIEFARLPYGANTDEQRLADYSMFVRLSASLWEVRHEVDFDAVIAHALTTASVNDLAHDELVLFLAAKMRACGLPVTPPAPGGQGVTNPDLAVANATHRCGPPSVYFEIKERSPRANRARSTLTEYVRRKIRDCAEQIRDRETGARGFACIDLGIVREEQIPFVGTVIRQELPQHRRTLYGVLVSATLWIHMPVLGLVVEVRSDQRERGALPKPIAL